MNPRRLVVLYPRRWRARYGEEFAQLIADAAGTPFPRLAADIIRGAFDAHLHGRFAVTRLPSDPATRRGVRDGMLISGLLAVLIVATNVIFPSGPTQSDDNPEHLTQNLITLVVLAALLMLIGIRGRRHAAGPAPTAAAKAGAAAGAVIAVMVTLTFITVNNLFLHIVSHQHDKRLAFAASGWSSMRAYLTVTQLRGALILIPALTLLGAVMGLIGATPARPTRRRTS